MNGEIDKIQQETTRRE